MKYDFDEIIDRRGTSCVKWDEAPEGVIPMWVADMDFKAAPAILEAIRKRAEHGVFGYTLVEDDYYEAIISWFQRRHRWTIQKDSILYTTGVIPAMSCAIKALTMPGEKVLILSPDYNCFFTSIRITAAKWQRVCCDLVATKITDLRWIGMISKRSVPMIRLPSSYFAIHTTPPGAFGQGKNCNAWLKSAIVTTSELSLTRYIVNW